MNDSTPISPPVNLQDIPPKWAHFCLGVEQFIIRELGVDIAGKNILTAFSGGIDSTALLLVLRYLSIRNENRIVAVHLDHRMRDDSAEDALHAEAVCRSLGVECIVESRDVPALAQKHSIGVEEAGRKARYELFARLLSSGKGDILATGHHLGDLCEDILMRLTRGAGWPGLSGMPGYDEQRGLIRPFLLTAKDTLRQFLNEIGVNWREDHTNADTTFKRNRVRHSLLPLFLEENPNFPETVIRMWRLGRIDADFWQEAVSECEETAGFLSRRVLDTSHQALRLRLYKHLLDELGAGQGLADTLLKLDIAWQEKRVGAVFQFPGDKTVKVTSKGLVFGFKH